MKGRLKDKTISYDTGKVRLSIEVDGEPDLPEGELDITIKKWREKRSLDANALLWHCIGEIANAIGEGLSEPVKGLWTVHLHLCASASGRSREEAMARDSGSR